MPIFLYGSESSAITKEDTQDQCPPSMEFPYASRHQAVSLHLQRLSSMPDQPTSTHGNYPGTVSNPIRAYRPNGRTQSRSGLPRLLCIGRDHQDDGG